MKYRKQGNSLILEKDATHVIRFPSDIFEVYALPENKLIVVVKSAESIPEKNGLFCIDYDRAAIAWQMEPTKLKSGSWFAPYAASIEGNKFMISGAGSIAAEFDLSTGKLIGNWVQTK